MNERGMSFIAVLLALAIVGLLYFGYMRMNTVRQEQSVGITAIEASKGVACRVQRQQIERDIMMWSASHDGAMPGSLDDLEAGGVHVPSCPEGGDYSLDGRHVVCSLHH
jgi:hypothetical protein